MVEVFTVAAASMAADAGKGVPGLGGDDGWQRLSCQPFCFALSLGRRSRRSVRGGADPRLETPELWTDHP